VTRIAPPAPSQSNSELESLVAGCGAPSQSRRAAAAALRRLLLAKDLDAAPGAEKQRLDGLGDGAARAVRLGLTHQVLKEQDALR
jgi:hypothetical protein